MKSSDIHMKRIKCCRIIVVLCLLLASFLYADIASDTRSFMECNVSKRRVFASYQKNGKIWIQIGDTVYSFPKSLDCSEIKFEFQKNDRQCIGNNGEHICHVVARDVLNENRIITKDFYSTRHYDGYYLYESDRKIQLKGEMLWGLGILPAFMKGNTIVLLHRNENRSYEIITYKIKGRNIREVKRDNYPYQMTVDSGGWPKDYIFPCDGKVCIYNRNTRNVYIYK